MNISTITTGTKIKTGPGPIIGTRNDWDQDQDQSSGPEITGTGTGPGPGPKTFSESWVNWKFITLNVLTKRKYNDDDAGHAGIYLKKLNLNTYLKLLKCLMYALFDLATCPPHATLHNSKVAPRVDRSGQSLSSWGGVTRQIMPAVSWPDILLQGVSTSGCSTLTFRQFWFTIKMIFSRALRVKR